MTRLVLLVLGMLGVATVATAHPRMIRCCQNGDCQWIVADHCGAKAPGCGATYGR